MDNKTATFCTSHDGFEIANVSRDCTNALFVEKVVVVFAGKVRWVACTLQFMLSHIVERDDFKISSTVVLADM